MEFDFACWRCGEGNAVWGEPVTSWWTQRYRLPDEWDRWRCGEINATPDD
ncbi:hypothetical protein [Streptomyces sedi]|nr:hypothetical protein [Streptomyces sedi]